MLTLYRGITVPESSFKKVKQEITRRGLVQNTERTWKMESVDLRQKLDALFVNDALSTKDTRPSILVEEGNGSYRKLVDSFHVVCACGDELGASYYASMHNKTDRNNVPLIIKFQADISNVQIDGKDFLYTAFQMGSTGRQRDKILEYFGDSVSRYLDKAWKSRENDFKIAICDVAIQDFEVIEAHYNNQTVIGGRHNTVFCSAFQVALPVESRNIVDLYRPRHFSFSSDFTLEEFRSY